MQYTMYRRLRSWSVLTSFLRVVSEPSTCTTIAACWSAKLPCDNLVPRLPIGIALVFNYTIRHLYGVRLLLLCSDDSWQALSSGFLTYCNPSLYITFYRIYLVSAAIVPVDYCVTTVQCGPVSRLGPLVVSQVATHFRPSSSIALPSIVEARKSSLAQPDNLARVFCGTTWQYSGAVPQWPNYTALYTIRCIRITRPQCLSVERTPGRKSLAGE